MFLNPLLEIKWTLDRVFVGIMHIISIVVEDG